MKDFEALVHQIRMDRYRLIAIDGNCGSGKSRLAEKLGKALSASVFHMDDFFIGQFGLLQGWENKERFEQIAGNIDTERFEKKVIGGILKRKAFSYQKYDCKQDRFTKVYAESKEINIIEGAFCMQDRLFHYYDFKIFLSVRADVQEKRIRQRNGEEQFEQFKSLWIPRENRYFDEMNVRERCDVVMDTSDWR